MEIADSPHLQGKGITTIKTEINDVKSEFPDPNGPQGHPGGWDPYYNPPGVFPPYPPPGHMYPGQYPPQFDPNYGPPWNAPNYYFHPPAWPTWGMPVAPNPYGGEVNPPGHVLNDAAMPAAPNNIEKPGIDAQKYGKRSRSEWETDESLPKNWKKRSFEIRHTNTKSGKATMFEYLSPSNQIYPSRSKMADHMREDGRYSTDEIDKVERTRKNYMSSGIQQKNFSGRFTEWETDSFLPAGWKKRSYQNNNRNSKTGKMTKYQYLNPEGQIIPSRIQVIDHMLKSGIYSQEDIMKVKEGKSHRRNNEMKGGGNNEGIEVYKYESNQGGYSNNQMNQSVDSALGNSINTSSQVGVNNCDPRETYKNDDNFRNPPNQWDQSNYINTQNNQFEVNDLRISANPPYINPNGISKDVKNENLLRKFPGVSFTKFQESVSTTKVTPIANDSRNVKDTVSLIKNLPGIALEQVTEHTPRMDDGSINENNLIKSSENLVNAETTSANYQNSWTNDNLIEKKRRKVERSEWEMDDSLPYGWKRRSYDNSWNRNGEKYSVTKYEYISPSEKMFNTRIKVLQHMLELPTVYSEEHIMNFQNSQKKGGRKAKPFSPDGNVENVDSMAELAYIAEHFYTNSEIPNAEIATDYADKTTNDSAYFAEKFYSNSEIPKLTEMSNYVANGHHEIISDNSDKAGEKSSSHVTEQTPIFENGYGISIERCSDKMELTKNNDMNKITNMENHSLKPFKELLISMAEESISDTENFLKESRNDNASNTNVSFYANEFINSTEKSSSYEGIASYNNTTKDSKNDVEPIEGHSDKIELTKNNDINKFSNIENHNLKPLVSTAEESINNNEKLFEESKNDSIYNTDVSFNANELINSTEIGNNSMNDSKEWSEKLSNENGNDNVSSLNDYNPMKETEEVFEQSGHILLESTEDLVQVNNDFGNHEVSSNNISDSSYSDAEMSNSHDLSDNHETSEVENCFSDATNISYDDSEISNSDSFDLSNGDFLERSDQYDAESNFSDKTIENDICDDTDFSETFSDDLPKESGQSDNSEMSLDNFCDDTGISNSDFSEICNGDISDKTENSELESDYNNHTKISIEDFSDYSDASDSDFTEVISDKSFRKNFCDAAGMSNSDFSEICNGDISDKTENSDLESDYSEASDSDFTEVISDDIPDNSSDTPKENYVENDGNNLDKYDLSNETDKSELGHTFSDNSKKSNNDSNDYSEISNFDLSELSSDNISENSEIFNDTPSENIETIDVSSEPLKQIKNCVDSDESNISETVEENSFPSFMGPIISMNVSEFSMLALLFTKNPNPSRSMIEDMSEDMEIASKDIKWTFIKLRAKFQGKKGQPVNSKPVEDLVDLIKTKFGQNTFTF